MHGSNDINEGTIPELGYDHRDVNLSAIVRWMSIFAMFVVVSIILIQFVFYPLFTPDWKKLERDVPAFVTAPRTPPYPQVQADPKLDMEIFKASEEGKHEGLRKAKATLAARGISGVTGEAPKEEGHSFPGSGDYTGATKHVGGEH
ncbi:hypothetical protein [Armatimonas sp.]|uniref:hypothetical protein n=1 Tax=Armatimonas sp. TaxID=1872638 RepID=UPI0037523396